MQFNKTNIPTMPNRPRWLKTNMSLMPGAPGAEDTRMRERGFSSSIGNRPRPDLPNRSRRPFGRV